MVTITDDCMGLFRDFFSEEKNFGETLAMFLR
jgi:hypothetical protein